MGWSLSRFVNAGRWRRALALTLTLSAKVRSGQRRGIEDRKAIAVLIPSRRSPCAAPRYKMRNW